MDNIFTLSSSKILVVFENESAMLEALANGVRPVSSFCSSLMKWNMEEWSFCRMVWLELSGIPPSAWFSSNMVKICSLWGKVLGFDDRTSRG